MTPRPTLLSPRSFHVAGLCYLALGLILIASVPDIWLALGISNFRQFIQDTGGGHVRTPGASFMLAHQTLFIAIACAIPGCALAAVFLRARPLLILAILFCTAAAQIVFITHHMAYSAIGGLTSGRANPTTHPVTAE